LVVGETKDVQANGFEELLAEGVFLRGVLVDGAIDFDDQVNGGAVEIDQKAVNGMLPAEFKIVELAVAQGLPEGVFARRWFVAHFTGQGFEFIP
jgi:hypothetical protein